MSFDLKPNQEKYNFISAYYKLTILTENNVQFLIMKNARKRLFPTFVQTLILNMTFFCTVVIWVFPLHFTSERVTADDVTVRPWPGGKYDLIQLHRQIRHQNARNLFFTTKLSLPPAIKIKILRKQ